MSSDRRTPPADGPYTWLDAADEVLDAAVDDEAEVECRFEEFEVNVPLRFGDDTPTADWRFDGTVRIEVDGLRRPLAEWFRMWGESPRSDESGAEREE